MKKPYFFMIVIFTLFCSCKMSDKKQVYEKWTGQTMGTYYSIVYESTIPVEQFRIDSIFNAINTSVSTYDEHSLISAFNKSGINEMAVDDHFVQNLLQAKEIYELTHGSFDPTVMPLVNYWGFGYTGHSAISNLDSLLIDSVRQITGMDHILIIEKQDTVYVQKDHPDVQLDFSALAKGYAADVIASWFLEKGIRNFLIEIGGDGLAMGSAKGGRNWRFGINEPIEESSITTFYQVISLSDAAIATSGNYRNYHELNGERYGHTINPKTGFPEKSNLLSATIISEKSIKADALATSCMVLGKAASMKLIEQIPNTEGYFIYIDESANLSEQYTSGFTKYLVH